MTLASCRIFKPLYLLVFLTGMASLAWEVFWQLKSTLALGVSAQGAALTLACTMGGMSLGALLMGQALRRWPAARPLRLYGALEILVGLSGLLLVPAFALVERIDTLAFRGFGHGALVHLAGIAAVLGLPALCMGATLPVFSRAARLYGTSVATLYGLNTLGAAGGALLAAFVLIPGFGVMHASWIVAGINILVGVTAWVWASEAPSVVGVGAASEPSSVLPQSPKLDALAVAVTGWATFALEVAWFRSLTAAFHSTTAAFAVMLAVVLLALGVAPHLALMLRRMSVSLGLLLALAGILILGATPLVERMDMMALTSQGDGLTAGGQAFQTISSWFMLALALIGVPMLFLGLALPWILEAQPSATHVGRLYALNTLAAIAGALGTAWLLLPVIGFARTSWLAGGLVALAGLAMMPQRRRLLLGGIAALALLLAVAGESGVGYVRVQGQVIYGRGALPVKILGFDEGPAVTTSVVEYEGGERRLIIDGTSASGQASADNPLPSDHYLSWMGRLPMLLHSDPRDALVICFGTGQTANAVRSENPRALDIVDINPSVYRLAPLFVTNAGVLDDPRVAPIVMDGRAYMRRSVKDYDVITLEPMPPIFAGVNALYAREFYALARARLRPHGIIAQWLPFIGLLPETSASIARTFQDVFPNAVMWIDPPSRTGILLGSKDARPGLGTAWPGFARTATLRTMTETEVRAALRLDQDALRRYGAHGRVITDDNQLLAYGAALQPALLSTAAFNRLEAANFALIANATASRP